MKKLYTSVIAMSLLAANAVAQQLPNAGFEGGWVDCVPWNTANTTTKQGTTPNSWCVSNVVTPGMSAGNQTIASNVAGNGSSSAVNVKNAAVVGQVIPGYFTLGTTWSTAKIALSTPSNTDGGTWGGISFAYRPDAMQFDYKRAHGSGSTQPATAVVYLWKGQTSQADVPGANSYKFLGTPPDPAKCTMINRERNILGLTTDQGGAVTKSADFEKIAATTYTFTNDASDWATLVVPIEYASVATPEMINVIFSAGDYFAARTSLQGSDELTVDNVRLLYYSRLASLKVNGVDVEGFAADKYEYTMNVADLPTADQIQAACLGQSGTAKATVAIDEAAKKATITVNNAQGADADGLNQHVYTINFTVEEKAPSIVATKDFTGLLKVDMGEGAQEMPNTVVTLNQYDDGTYGMLLKNFGASADDPVGMGDIVLTGLKLDGTALSGRVEGFELAGGSIKANIDLAGTYDEKDLVLHLDINAYEPIELPVKVDFTTILGPNIIATKDFTGLLKVDMGEGAQEMPNTVVTLNQYDDGTYGMLLKNFGASADDPVGMGDIVLTGLKLDGTALSGRVEGFELAGGSIKANIDLAGTYDEKDLVLHLDINAYEPIELPVKVDFYSPAELGAIGEIATDENAETEYFNLQGIRVNGNELTPGIYVRRQGNKVQKVLVK